MQGTKAFSSCVLVTLLLAGCVGTTQPPPDNLPDPSGYYPGEEADAGTSGTTTPTPSDSPEEAPMRDTGMILDVGEGVSVTDIDLIRRGLTAAGDYINARLGGDIPVDFRANVTVKIVATGRGNEEPGGGGSCCTGLSESAAGNMRPFFDVAHSDWLNQGSDVEREKIVIHEYTHGWQNFIGCGNQYSQPLGNWMSEGMAEQVAYAVLIERGLFSKEDVLDFITTRAKSGDGTQWNTPLSQQVEPGQSGIWSGNIGYVALELALDGTSNGLMQLRSVCTEVARGATLEEAFATTFDRPLDDFYKEFERWKGFEREPEPEYGLSCNNEAPTNTMQFDVASNVPEKDMDIIRCGFANGQDFLDRELGGGISDSALADIDVEVVAHGESNTCCEAFATRIFFDVSHQHWLNPWEGWPADPQREVSGIHEFTHTWQGQLGCLGSLGGAVWDEGIATQVPYASMIERGHFDKDDVLTFMESAAKSGDGAQWNMPLREVEKNGYAVWPGHIGYLALEFAMNLDSAPHDLMSLRVICEEVAGGATPEEAFQTTFGIDKESFYSQFEEWKDQQS